MNELQVRLLDIAKAFKKVCEENNLTYFLDGGSLLGAVRHRGFIPWDDDFDFIMPRDSFEKLIALNDAHKDLFGEHFMLRSWRNTNDFIWSNLILVDKRTTKISKYLMEHELKFKNGVCVDIFVLENGGSDKKMALAHFLQLKKLCRKRIRKMLVYRVSSRNKFPIKNITNLILYAYKKSLRHEDFYREKYEKLCKKYESKDSSFIANPLTLLYYPNSLFLYRPQTFLPSQELPFEDTTFAAPRNFDAYLTNLFGDYMTPPPKEKQVGTHEAYYLDLNLPFCEYDF